MAKDQAQAETSQELVAGMPRLSDDDLRTIQNVDDAVKLLKSQGVDLVNIADVIGTGFELVTEERVKRQLVGVPFVVLAWGFSLGDYGPFTTLYIVTGKGGKYIVNDGSTGIREQLDAYSAKTGKQQGMIVNHGFRVSDYRIDKETKKPVPANFTGETEPAATFYLDTSR